MLAARSASAIDDKNGGRLLANSSAAPQSAGSAVSLKFTGKAGEYFRIWIVNVCLSVVTLGIYSAWAKVRRKRLEERRAAALDIPDYLSSHPATRERAERSRAAR